MLYLKTNPEIRYYYFRVKDSYFNDTSPENKINNDDNWETLKLSHQYDNNINYITVYYLDIHENTQCALISIILEYDLN